MHPHSRNCRRTDIDLNREYAAHQHAIMEASAASNDNARQAKLEEASEIAARITDFQRQLGAAAACAWSMTQLAKARPGTP